MYRTSSRHDDYTTPKYVWEQIKDFIPTDSIIWESAYCNGSSGNHLTDMGFKTIHEDKDYFNWEPENYTIQITNPPFSNKKEWIKRAMELGKPWIMVMPLETISTKFFIELTKGDIQLIIPVKRIFFEKIVDDVVIKKTSSCFTCCYFCHGLNLPKDLNFIQSKR